MEQLAKFCNNPFKGFNTEYLFSKKLAEDNLYEAPLVISLNNTVTNCVVNSEICLEEYATKGVIIPIKFQIKRFFEIEGMYEDFANHMNILSNCETIKNFVNGKIWKSKMKNYPNKIVFPFFLYFDDFEINNPLGSHSSGLLGVYFSFPTAPDHLKCKLDNIFIAALLKSTDVKELGNDKCFFRLIEILNDLEKNGLEIQTKSGNIRVFFVLGLIVGDNLALNNILGFSRSFSSNHFCRICKLHKSQTTVAVEEDPGQLRNLSNYEHDVNLNDSKLTGVVECSIFNKINNFHVTENIYCDVLHDMLEGVLNYDLCHIIQHFIQEKTFDLEELNIRKQSFSYGESTIGNIFPPITANHLKGFRLKASASEMLTFAHFFPLIIGEKVNTSTRIWKFVINLIELLDLVLLTNFTALDIANLKSHVCYHNEEYQKLFSDTLKPKHHFLSHYSTIVENSGPLVHLWTFHFESKHRELKTYTKNITSRKNITLSLAIKFGYNFAEKMLNFCSHNNVLGKVTYRAKCSPFCKDLVEILGLKEEDLSFNCHSNFKICGTNYKKGGVVYCFGPKMRAFKILEIFALNNVVYYLANELDVLSYDSNFLSYLINDKTRKLLIQNISTVKSPSVNLHIINSCSYLRPKASF
ncbi:uncharacterized protein LOC142230559 [Haematobia irritans]|uniref:uncharacterized protein LOC142230559 n=1 Tax=Haematobia irritans TaxID=7368 RepID=UPI003F505D23